MITIKRYAICFLLILFFSNILIAVQPKVEMELFHRISYLDEAFTYTPFGTIGLTFASPSDPNVRGDVALSFSDGEDPSVHIQRAYLRVRFPSAVRLTIGKTRLGWGEGRVFNAGEILFEQNTSVPSLSSVVPTSYLASVQIPTGPFSFIETVILPPYQQPYLLSDTTIASRIYSSEGQIKLEGGAALRWKDKEARITPYVALQGSFGPDWYLSCSADIIVHPLSQEELHISGGLFYLWSVGWSGRISTRLEASFHPFGVGEEDSTLLLYPEIIYIPEENLSFTLQSMFNPFNCSGMVFLGASWNGFQGLTFSSLFSFQAGKHQLPNYPSYALTVGASWIY